jgi:hypothetical protein
MEWTSHISRADAPATVASAPIIGVAVIVNISCGLMISASSLVLSVMDLVGLVSYEPHQAAVLPAACIQLYFSITPDSS